ncbi:lmo0937 family membrane protein [Pricia antarctica]|uniref:lmo0937 family membrane protein n=1 Tax=Pricia antarctica TaxID=641691 RepID=UPI000B277CF9|nr:lmo0937 family membrane protein [Pricia antarctica]
MKNILWILVVILLIGWVFGFLVFKVLGGLIHILLVVAVILLVYNFITGKNKSSS